MQTPPPPDPTALAAHFDHNDPAQMEQPYALYKQLRASCPISHSDAHGGFWLAMRYADVAAIARNFRVFSSEDGVTIPRQPTSPMYPLELDPPLHTEFKTALTPLFHVTAAEALMPEVEAEVDRILDEALPQGRIDFVQLADHIPAHFALTVIGVDAADRPQLLEWVDFLVHGRTNPQKAQEVGALFDGYVSALIARRRQEPPRGDVISSLFELDIPGMGGRLTDDQVRRTVVILIFGGLHTTRSATLEALYYIAKHPDIRAALLARMEDAAFWAKAVEEFLRYSTPTQILKRRVNQDVALHGQALKPGADIMICFASANHDERQFANPDEVMLERSPNQHMSFGMGPHRCIGQNLARVFLRGTLRRVLARIPDYRLPEDFEPRYQVGEARAMVSLPVLFTPGAA